MENFKQQDDEIAIIGLGYRLPPGEEKEEEDDGKVLKYTPKKLWNKLMNKFDGVISTNERWSENYHKLGEIGCNYAGLVPLEEWKLFDPLFFGINPSDALNIDPQQRLLLKCTWEALEDAMIDPIKIRGSNTSVFMGGTTCDYKDINYETDEIYTNLLSTNLYSIANRISYSFDLNGESISLDTACSSSLNAVMLGINSIRNGNSNLSIVGGVNLVLDPMTSKSYTYLSMLSKSDGKCKVFDASADGFTRGEGAGIVVLKSLKQAIKDGNNIYCVLKGISSNVDGNGLSDKSNHYSPSSQSQANNIRLALKSTNGSVSPSDIDYVEAHGTGTPTGDPIELEGISMVFKDHKSSSNPLLIGSIKSNIGHCEAASGVASLIKCCLMFKHQCFAPNIHFNTPNPSIKFDEWKLKVVTDPIPFNSNKLISMAINNFGITGSNTCIILSQFKPTIQTPTPTNESSLSLPKLLIPFSANSIESLKQYLSIIKDGFSTTSDFNKFVKKQILNKSKSLYQRSVIIANDWNQFNDDLNKIKSTDPKPSNLQLSSSKKNNPITVFVFCGQGSQYNSMALELYNNNEIFRESMDLLNSKLSKYYGYSVLDHLRSIKDNDLLTLHDSMVSQPTICMVQVSLVQLYKHWGIEPSFIVGHSLGEIIASYCSGMMDIDTFCYVVYNRSILQATTNGCGKMLSISCSSDEFNLNYSSRYPSIEIACYNSPSSIVIAGNEQQLIEISNDLKDKGIFTALLGSLSSFHTSSQLVIKDQLLQLNFTSSTPKIPIFSTTTTKLFDSTTPTFNKQFVFENILSPVYFDQTISNLYKHIETNQLGNEIVFIEIAPHPTLSFYLKQMIPKNSNYFKNNGGGDSISIYSPLNKKKNDIQQINEMISNLYCNNYYNINFKCQLQDVVVDDGSNDTNDDIQLPLYQWDDEIHWKCSFSHQNRLLNGPPINHLGNLNYQSPNIKSYQSLIDISREPFKYLKGHVVKNKYYFPGCGYIDNILNMYPSQDLIIEHLEFNTPVIFIDGINQALQTNVYESSNNNSNNNSNSYKVQFHFKDNKTNEWINCSNGQFKLINQMSDKHNKPKCLDIESILKNACNLTKLSKNELYQNIKMKTGLAYSGYFQAVEQVYLGVNCSLIKVSTKNPNESIGSSSFFNTSILDCCLHGTLGLIEEKCQIVFEKIQGLKYYSSNIPDATTNPKPSTIYVYSKLKSIINDSYSSSIIATLMDGTILFEIENSTSKSLIPIKDSLKIEYPTNELYLPYYQSLESLIQSPLSIEFIRLFKDNEMKLKQLSLTSDNIYEQFIPTILLSSIRDRCPELSSLSLINTLSLDQLKQKYCINNKFERLFIFVFESIKRNLCGGENNTACCAKELSEEQWNQSNINNYLILLKSAKIIAKLLFPLENDDTTTDTPQSLFEDNILEEFYKNQILHLQNELIGDMIQECIKPLVNEKLVFRILEFGGGTGSLSIIVLDRINKLLKQFPNHQIEIEYTWSDISNSFIPNAKEILSKLITSSNNINIIYRALDLDQPLINGDKQQLIPSYYDIIVMTNVLHVIKDIRYGLTQLNDLLLPNGQLLFVEPTYRSIHDDCIFGLFDQWWAFTDTDIRKDRCTMDRESWIKVLTDCNFINISMANEIKDYGICYLIQTQKPSLNNILQNQSSSINSSSSNIIIFRNSSDNNNNFKNHFIKQIENNNNNSSIYQISNINEFKNLIESEIINNESIIYFTKSLENLNLNNFKSVTLEYIQINQLLLLEHKLIGCKHILLSINSEGNNYLASSIIGSYRYFYEFPQLKLYSISIDSNSTLNYENINLLSIIKYLTNSIKNTIQNEIIIKNNNKIYYERYKHELKLKNSFNSNSFEIGNTDENNDNLLVSLTPNLEYQLNTKQIKLNENEIEVKVLASGIGYKDYLVYSGQLQVNENNGNNNLLPIGNDFSGIVTRVGSSNTLFKIGDQVYGIGNNTTSSHIIIDKKQVYYKPKNISHSEAASIPSIYLTNLYGIFNIGGLDINENETILIHSEIFDICLSALQILKWKSHKAPIYIITDSKEKQQFILNNFNDHLSIEIYSSKIKNSIQGVDLIINTLSNNDELMMNENIKCLSNKGRIIDLSIVSSNEITFKFKNNFGYHNIDIMKINKLTISNLLKELSNAIENDKLKLIPIIEYSNLNIKEAFENNNIKQFKDIEKVIINHDTNNNIVQEMIEKESKKSNYSILKSNYKINELGNNIIITGQSGIAFEILKWIVEFGYENVKNIIILSKSSLKWELEFLISKTLKKSNNRIKFHFKSVDVSNTELLNQAIDQVLIENPSINNIDTILHYAFVQIACKVNEINMNHLDISHGAKTMGAINLHNQSIKRTWKLLNFIMASSVASVLGSEDQCSYVSSCLLLDNLSKYRKSIGLPSICINYGYIESTGFMARNESIAMMVSGEGIGPISTNKLLGSLDLKIQNQSQSTNSLYCDFDFKNIKNKNQSSVGYYHPMFLKFDYYLNSSSNMDSNNSNNKNQSLIQDGNENLIGDLFLNKVSELLSVDVSKINTGIKLLEYGADSLFIVQLKNWIDKNILANMISIQQLQTNTIEQSIQIIIQSINNNNNNKNDKVDMNDQEYWKKEIKLENSIINLINDKVKQQSSRMITNDLIIEKMNENMVLLLTGSTGFLGGYLLWHFIKLLNCSKVYCLIRNKSNLNSPIDEILNNLKRHKLYNDDEEVKELIKSKVNVLVGDLSKKKFNLSDQEYSLISENVNLIVNSGADIDLKSTYQHTKQVNVHGLKELIKLSVSGNGEMKFIVNFSSASVFLNEQPQDDFNDSTTIPSIDKLIKLPVGYMQSKIVSENLLNEACSHGLNAILLRPPTIFSNSINGIGSNNDIFLLLIQACYALGYYPNDIDTNFIMVPIDWVSEKIIKLITNQTIWKDHSLANSLNIFNMTGESTHCNIVFKYLENEFNCKGIKFDNWFEMMEKSNNLSCIKLKTFHDVTHVLKVNNFYYGSNFSSKTKSTLQSINSYDNGWLVTSKIVKNHINHIFNL